MKAYPAIAGAVLLVGCATSPATRPVPVISVPIVAPPPVADPVAAERIKPYQYLYGSGEAAAGTVQTWRALVGYVRAKLGGPVTESVVLAPGATLEAPSWLPCGAKPKAAVFDVDETVLLNLGFEYDQARGEPYAASRWEAFERTGGRYVAPTPGARAALAELRAMKVTVVFNTNRDALYAREAEAALDDAGVGPARHGETLFLQGDDDGGGKKDRRRQAIAAKYCVVAMGGDQLGDFSDLFNAGLTPGERRRLVQSAAITARWGNGWFVMPNPVYGSSLKGGVDDLFPATGQWPGPADTETK